MTDHEPPLPPIDLDQILMETHAVLSQLIPDNHDVVNRIAQNVLSLWRFDIDTYWRRMTWPHENEAMKKCLAELSVHWRHFADDEVMVGCFLGVSRSLLASIREAEKQEAGRSVEAGQEETGEGGGGGEVEEKEEGANLFWKRETAFDTLLPLFVNAYERSLNWRAESVTVLSDFLFGTTHRPWLHGATNRLFKANALSRLADPALLEELESSHFLVHFLERVVQSLPLRVEQLGETTPDEVLDQSFQMINTLSCLANARVIVQVQPFALPAEFAPGVTLAFKQFHEITESQLHHKLSGLCVLIQNWHYVMTSEGDDKGEDKGFMFFIGNQRIS